jgi:hypothetical protein
MTSSGDFLVQCGAKFGFIVGILIVWGLFHMCSCSYDPECVNRSGVNIVPPYKVENVQPTPSGIKVDTSGWDVSLEMVDTVVNSVERCLAQTFPGKIPKTLRESAWCNFEKVRPLKRDCITIKIPSSCFLSKDESEYLLDRKAPEYLCEQKENYEPEHGCFWRTGIQEDETIVTCPDLYMLPDPIVRYMTSCTTAWEGDLAKCAKPLTEKLTGDLL